MIWHKLKYEFWFALCMQNAKCSLPWIVQFVVSFLTTYYIENIHTHSRLLASKLNDLHHRGTTPEHQHTYYLSSIQNSKQIASQVNKSSETLHTNISCNTTYSPKCWVTLFHLFSERIEIRSTMLVFLEKVYPTNTPKTKHCSKGDKHMYISLPTIFSK
jgi:hypothetical protein